MVVLPFLVDLEHLRERIIIGKNEIIGIFLYFQFPKLSVLKRTFRKQFLERVLKDLVVREFNKSKRLEV